ncbi:succinate dehydrogenase-like protein [Polychaeton citri CBS 116435]|uniref:Succinate dehydrogenase [ubiquinone] cytochrome b small subunit n=1 Tax=Polychaeton citri CBS 116435 TaxID=1314669 RepID=A0A9P4PXT4_9PEZI|nr:succinate dehydrogenase-like protein [Polychaeton citri CBS 116435]
MAATFRTSTAAARAFSLASPAFRTQFAARSTFTLQSALRRSAFHTSPVRALLPPLPQKIQGTVNDPVNVPSPSPTHGSYHWTIERVVSAALVPLTIAPFAAGALNPLMDGIFISAILLHSHIGFQSVIIDYLPNWRVPTIRKLFNWALNLAFVVVGWGFYEFETNDVGLTEGVKRIWKA